LTVSEIVQFLLREETTAEEAAILDQAESSKLRLTAANPETIISHEHGHIRVLPSATTRR
jgi:hypothetical protein